MFLKNKNSIFKIRRSKVTDYAALSDCDMRFNLHETGGQSKHVCYQSKEISNYPSVSCAVKITIHILVNHSVL